MGINWIISRLNGWNEWSECLNIILIFVPLWLPTDLSNELIRKMFALIRPSVEGARPFKGTDTKKRRSRFVALELWNFKTNRTLWQNENDKHRVEKNMHAKTLHHNKYLPESQSVAALCSSCNQHDEITVLRVVIDGQVGDCCAGCVFHFTSVRLRSDFRKSVMIVAWIK